MTRFKLSAVAAAMVLFGFASAPSYAADDAEPAAGPPPAGNMQMFTPAARELVAGKQFQDISALAVLGVFVLLGLTQLRNRHAVLGSLAVLAGVTVFYSAWIHHKWTISGGMPILYGHLVSLGAGTLGVAVGTLGLIVLTTEKAAPLSRSWLLPYAFLLTLGVVTGTAAIFEAGPTIFGIDPPLEKLAVMVGLGSAATASSIVCFTRAVARMT